MKRLRNILSAIISLLFTIFLICYFIVYATHPVPIVFFVISYLISFLSGYFFFVFQVKSSEEARSYISNQFLLYTLFMGVIPVLGAIFYLLGGMVIAFLPYTALPLEEYQEVTRFWLESYAEKLTSYKSYRFTPLGIIYNNLSFEEFNWLLGKLEKMEWSPYKSRLLRLIVEYSRFPSIVIEASYIILRKKDEVLDKIVSLESQAYFNPQTYYQLAQLYHEIYYLSLETPPIDRIYLKKAVDNLERIVNLEDYSSALELAVLYNLRLGNIDKAEEYLQSFEKKYAILNSEDVKRFIDLSKKEIAFKRGEIVV